MTDEKILKALKVLAAADQDREASPALAARLRAQFRAHRRKRGMGRAAAWTLAAAAAGVIAVLVLSNGPARTPVPVISEAPAVAALSTPSAPTPAPPLSARRGKRVPRAVAVPQRRAPAIAPQVVTDFYPLLDPAPPFERGQLLRVNLPASAMRSVGLPVHEDRLNDAVQADVLLGEEGLPRAIRFVGFQVR